MHALHRSQNVDQLCSRAELHWRYWTRATHTSAKAYIWAIHRSKATILATLMSSSSSSSSGAPQPNGMPIDDSVVSLYSKDRVKTHSNWLRTHQSLHLRRIMTSSSRKWHRSPERPRDRTSASAVVTKDTSRRHAPTLPCPDGFSLRRNSTIRLVFLPIANKIIFTDFQKSCPTSQISVKSNFNIHYIDE
jgi:hypothetical protein